MRCYRFGEFGLEHLNIEDVATPEPGPGEVRIDVKAASLNYRDVMVVQGRYNPKLPRPATPLSDGAGVVSAIGDDVEDVAVGDRVVTQFVADWQDGPFRASYVASTLGCPGPGVAAEQVVLPARAVLKMPDGMSFETAATLPIAALTAWSALVTEGKVEEGQTVLTLGTGGVSIFALQLGRALGAQVIVTSSKADKRARAEEMGAVATIDYTAEPRWEKRVVEQTDGLGVDVVVETGGAGTLSQSLRAVKAGGVVALLGALTGMKAEIDVAPLVMRRIHVAGILVDSKAHFADLLRFVTDHHIEPVVDARFPFTDLRPAMEHMLAGKHFGKILVHP